MKVTQYFTGHGILGVLFFIVGYPLSGWIVAGWFQAGPTGPSGSSLAFGAVVGIATLASVPLMLIGREYTATGSLPPSK